MKIQRKINWEICEIDLSGMPRKEVIALKREIEQNLTSVSDAIEIAMRTQSTAAGLRKMQRAKRALVAQLNTTEKRLLELRESERQAHEEQQERLLEARRDVVELERRIGEKNARAETFERIFLRQAEIHLPRGTFNHIANLTRLLMPRE